MATLTKRAMDGELPLESVARRGFTRPGWSSYSYGHDRNGPAEIEVYQRTHQR